MSDIEYRVWLETGDLIEVFDNAPEAAERADLERAECPCGTSGADGECGVIHPHGVSIQVVKDGEDITQDYLINGSV